MHWRWMPHIYDTPYSNILATVGEDRGIWILGGVDPKKRERKKKGGGDRAGLGLGGWTPGVGGPDPLPPQY